MSINVLDKKAATVLLSATEARGLSRERLEARYHLSREPEDYLGKADARTWNLDFISLSILTGGMPLARLHQ